jgi:hypothetical protein
LYYSLLFLEPLDDHDKDAGKEEEAGVGGEAGGDAPSQQRRDKREWEERVRESDGLKYFAPLSLERPHQGEKDGEKAGQAALPVFLQNQSSQPNKSVHLSFFLA